MRLLRDESLDLLARESGQPGGRIAPRRESFWPSAARGCSPDPNRLRTASSQRPSARSASRRWRSTPLKVLLEKKGDPSVAEALEVSEQLPAPFKAA